MFAGFNVAFLPMHLSGLLGMPRRVYTYHTGQGLDLPNLVSTIGALVLAAGFAVLLYDALRTALRRGNDGRDPWRAGTLEWLGGPTGPPGGPHALPPGTDRTPGGWGKRE